jgi:WhiB family redox-sensing transcriptional regulator
MSVYDWQDDALCAQTAPEMFFPGKGDGATARVTKRLCASCDVLEQCLSYALAQSDEIEGIWGGTSPKERRLLRRQANERKAA